MWPDVEGRYKTGGQNSPVAVCTMASIEMEIPMEKVAICGKCVTENIGIEKIIKNVISNPKIRYLILCGKVSKGHFVGQAIKSLIENGIDENKNIIGARGAMPVLKNIKNKEVERFRKQVEAIDLIGEENIEKIKDKIEECFNKNPGPYEDSEAVETDGPERIVAEKHEVKEWVQDPGGFFTVHPDHEKGEIIVEHYNNDRKLQRIITGKNAEDIYHKIIKLGMLSRQDHAAYLGRELGKAEIALKNKLNYEQDSDLSFPIFEKKNSANNSVKKPENSVTKTYVVAAGKPCLIVNESAKEEQGFRNLLRSIGLYRIF